MIVSCYNLKQILLGPVVAATAYALKDTSDSA
jgi:hypothetical protein